MMCPAAHVTGSGDASLWGASFARLGGTLLSCTSWGLAGLEVTLALQGCLVLKLAPNVCLGADR